ncbi:hypothetical protein [Streptomyces sp. NPDC004658]|uniref:hypothetical protein n=1 Tax=Streptomyces sp. NPDC004658 TaxID=3154672 RepID=UPI0033AFB648
MHDLLAEAIQAHGGLDRWNHFDTLRATIVSGGELYVLKGMPQDPAPREQVISLHRQSASVQPFGAPDQKTRFTPEHVAIEKLDGTVVAERSNPRASFAGHELTTAWDPLQRAYFNGYALWTYLTVPFSLTTPGTRIESIAPWQEGAETWRGLRATFPTGFASHSQVQEFYFGDDGLLRRHDYHLDVAGGDPATQYVYDIVDVAGIRVATRRHAFMRAADNSPLREREMVFVNISNLRFS